MKPLLALAISILFLAPLGALGRAEAAPPATTNPDEVVVEGTLRRVGTGTFNDLVITDAQGQDWYINADEASLFRGKEQTMVRVRAIKSSRRMTLANGKELPPRLELTKITIIK